MTHAVNRREFLRLGAAAGGVWYASPSAPTIAYPQRLERRDAPQKIVVLGAGLAGLSAGYELAQAGHEVTILEAQRRAGGRVHTIREPFADGLYAEAGAMRFTDAHVHLRRYVNSFNLPATTQPQTNLPLLYYLRGRRMVVRGNGAVDWPYALTPEEKTLGRTGLNNKYLVAPFKDLGNPAVAGWPDASARALDRLTLAEVMHREGASREAIALLSQTSWFARHAATRSALKYALVGQGLYGGRPTYAIDGGNDRIPRAFADRLGERIHYGSQVVKIVNGPDRVHVVYMQGGVSRTLEGDRVVCAIPASMLIQIEVTPPFSAEKRDAIQRVKYDACTRVYLQSRRRFWLDEGVPGGAATDLLNGRVVEHPLNRPDDFLGRTILELEMSGEGAQQVAAMPESERIKVAVEQIEKVHPRFREYFEGGISKCWSEDPWVRGAYSISSPGLLTTWLPQIGRPEGRVHFAGEHTSLWSGTMEGALDSGNRVAREVNGAVVGSMTTRG